MQLIVQQRCYCIFTYRLTCKHITQRIWNKKHLMGITHSCIIGLMHCKELEKRIEIHKLYPSNLINIFLSHSLLEILLHSSESMRVTISQRVAKNSAIIANKDEIASPCINTYTLDINITVCDNLQSLNNFIIKSIYIPIKMATCLDKIIVKTCKFLQRDLSAIERAYYSSATGRAQVDSKKTFYLIHYIYYYS